MKVSTSHFNEDILCVHSDFSWLRVNNGRQRKNLTSSIIENWVSRLIFDNVQILLQFLIFLEFLEQLLCIHAFSLFKCLENNIFWFSCFISDWSLNLIIVMGSHWAKGSSSANVLMKLILQINEWVVGLEIELDISENSSYDIGSYFLCLRFHNNLF